MCWQISGDGPIDLVLIASGAELDLVVKAGETLAEEGVNVRIISMPSQELFVAQPKSYQDEVMLPSVKARLAVEAGSSLAGTAGWQ